MFKQNQSNKKKTNYENNDLQINTVAIEANVGNNKKNDNKILKINNNIYNIKNIDNNMSHGNLNDIKTSNNNSERNIKNKNLQKNLYQFSNQTNFKIVSHIKKFDSPLLINNYALNFIGKSSNQVNNKKFENNSIIENCKNYEINKSNIFISGKKENTNNIKITNSSRKDNLLHREITNLKNINIINEKTNKELNKEEIERNNLLFSLDTINNRWMKALNEYKMRLSYINHNEILLFNMDRYRQELLSKIDFENDYINRKDNCFIIVKQDIECKENQIVYEIMNSSSKKDFEESLNKFIINNNKENIQGTYNIYNNNETVLNNGKKKSKFINSNINNNIKKTKNLSSPFLIFNYLELKKIVEEIENNLNIGKKIKSKDQNYILENSISFFYKNIKKIEPSVKKEKEIINIKKYVPTKVYELRFIHENINIKNNKLKNIKVEEIKLIINNNHKTKIKETNDFGQITPISLLKDKYFIYAVSKWSKFSTINSEENISIRYNYKSGHPRFDSNILKINNFYIKIEKIKEDEVDKKSRNTSKFTSFKKTYSSGKFITKTNKENNKVPIMKSGINSKVNYNNIEITVNKKKSKSKPKLGKNAKK